jgi:hypothetical protein
VETFQHYRCFLCVAIYTTACAFAAKSSGWRWLFIREAASGWKLGKLPRAIQ